MPEEDRDQIVLATLQQYKTSGAKYSSAKDALISWIIADGTKADKVVHFAPILGVDGMHSMADATLQKIVELYPEVPIEGRHQVRGLMVLHRMFYQHRHIGKNRLKSVRDAISTAMAKSLVLVQQIEYWLVMRPTRNIPCMLDSAEERASIATHMRDSFIRTFVNGYDINLAQTIDDPFVLLWLLRPSWDQRDPEAPSEDAAGWSPAAEVIVSAAAKRPQNAGIALAIALTTKGELKHEMNWEGDEARPVDYRDVNFDETFAHEFLGEHFDRAMEVLARIDVDGLKGQAFDFASTVINYAKSYSG